MNSSACLSKFFLSQANLYILMFNFYSNFGRPANKAAGMESRDGDLGLDEFSRYDAMTDMCLLLCAFMYLYLAQFSNAISY